MGSESEALGWKHVFSAFHRANMSTQDTQVNTVGCIFSSKNQTEYLKTLYLRRVARTCIVAVQVGTTLIVLIRSLRTKAYVIATSYLFHVLQTQHRFCKY